MSAGEAVTEAELCALVDGELTEAQRISAETWLDEHPEAAARIAIWRKQKELIRSRFSSEGAIEAAAEARSGRRRLVRAAYGLTRSRRSTKRYWMRVAGIAGLSAAVAVSTVGIYLVATLLIPESGTAGGTFLGVQGKKSASSLPAVEGTDDGRRSTLTIFSAPRGVLVGPQYFGTRLSTPIDNFRYASHAHAVMGGSMQLRFDLASPDLAQLSQYLVKAIGPEVALPKSPPGLRPVGVRLMPGERGLAGYVALNSDAGESIGLYITRAGFLPPSQPVFYQEDGLNMVNFVTERASVTMVSRSAPQSLIEWADRLRVDLEASHT